MCWFVVFIKYQDYDSKLMGFHFFLVLSKCKSCGSFFVVHFHVNMEMWINLCNVHIYLRSVNMFDFYVRNSDSYSTIAIQLSIPISNSNSTPLVSIRWVSNSPLFGCNINIQRSTKGRWKLQHSFCTLPLFFTANHFETIHQ